MDSKKKIRRKDASADALNTPKKSCHSNEILECDFPDDISSADFLNSQECFSVGWDWSSHIKGHRKPTIRVVERPVQKKKQEIKLLECSRPRRLIRNHNTDAIDDSDFVNELKSLAAGCKGIQETTSPVASPPSFRRRNEVLVTPTALRESMRNPSCSKSAESSASVSSLPSSSKEIPEKEKENLEELLDDSLGADLLKCTQDLEQGLKQNELKTPNPHENQSNRFSSAKKRNRLSLSSKKGPTTSQKSVCRRINDVYEEKPQNNNNDSIKFDDIDEAMMLTIGKLNEEEFVKSQQAVSSKHNTGTSNEIGKAKGTKLILEDEDDDFVSPDLLDLIDVWEKKATQERVEAKKQSLTNNLSNKKVTLVGSVANSSKDLAKPQASKSVSHSSGNYRKQYDTLLAKQERGLEASNQQPPRKTLCLGKSRTFCTPEEIEKKRQDAKKRLQLKKRCQ